MFEILDSLGIPVAVLSYPELKYVTVNIKKCQILGKILGCSLNKEEIIGKRVNKITSFPQIKGIYEMALLSGYINQTVVLDKVKCIDATKNPLFLKIIFSPISKNGKTLYITEVGIDLTEQIIIQDKIQESYKLKEEFFSIISHELRTPINIILNAEKVITNSIKNLNHREIDKIQKWLKIIRQNSLRLLKLINNILDISRIEAGYLKVHMKNIDIVNFIRKVFFSVEPFLKQKGFKTNFFSTANSLITAVDEEKIERVMLNLISNSAKYNKEGGEINITISHDNKNVYITVSDTGIGIPEEKLDTIFDRFQQVNPSLSCHNGGTGIGLSLCKKIAELHNGNISVKSELNHGSAFTLSLPIRKVNNVSENILEKIEVSRKIADIEFSDIYEI